MFDDTSLTDCVILAVISALVAYGIVKAIYNHTKHRRSAYHQYLRTRKRRAKVAARNGDQNELKQIKLEKKWTDSVEFGAAMSYLSWRGLGNTQAELDAKKYEILSEIEVEQFELPNVHTVKKIDGGFLNDTVHEYAVAYLGSEYSSCAYFPESILPYPRNYLLFALDYLISVDYGQQTYNTLRSILINRCLDIKPSLLPIGEENKRVGEQMKNASS